MLDPLIHQELRLSIMSFVSQVDWATFARLLEATGASKGNLSVQISKLQKADYVQVKKSFKDNYPLTEVAITENGRKALSTYVAELKKLVGGL